MSDEVKNGMNIDWKTFFFFSFQTFVFHRQWSVYIACTFHALKCIWEHSFIFGREEVIQQMTALSWCCLVIMERRLQSKSQARSRPRVRLRKMLLILMLQDKPHEHLQASPVHPKTLHLKFYFRASLLQEWGWLPKAWNLDNQGSWSLQSHV